VHVQQQWRPSWQGPDGRMRPATRPRERRARRTPRAAPPARRTRRAVRASAPSRAGPDDPDPEPDLTGAALRRTG
jgi:hypothetical protein